MYFLNLSSKSGHQYLTLLFEWKIIYSQSIKE